MFRYIIAATVGFGSGAVAAGAVYAFISAIGVVPRLAQKTDTVRHIKLLESALMLGGMFAISSEIIRFEWSVGRVVTGFAALCTGVFIGALAMSLAETLDVLPIMTRRLHLQKGMVFFIIAIAAGKMCGALLHALVPGFYTA